MQEPSARLPSGEELWERYCADIDGLLDEFARKRRAMQRRLSMGEPCRSLAWDDGDARCTLSLLVCEPPVEAGEPEHRLAIWPAAYRDDPVQLVRTLWELPEPFLLAVPVTREALTPVLDQAVAFLAAAPNSRPPSREVPICGVAG